MVGDSRPIPNQIDIGILLNKFRPHQRIASYFLMDLLLSEGGSLDVFTLTDHKSEQIVDECKEGQGLCHA